HKPILGRIGLDSSQGVAAVKKLLVLAALGVILVGVFGSFEAGAALAFGWAAYLIRVVPRITVDWPSVGVGLAAIVLFTGGFHFVGRSWRKAGAPEAPKWRLRWSLTAVAVVFLLFVAGICMIGMTHQLGWLVTAREPVWVPTLKYQPSG